MTLTPKGAARRDALLEAVIRLLESDGPSAVTHRAVAREAGVPLAAATYYFASIDDLLVTAMKRAVRLSRAFPVEWARRVHFPVMLYFSGFIVIHVILVLATGALRNLNHMYAAQGSTDPTAFADNWVGLGMFALSLLVIAAGLAAARPAVLVPIARLFGTVSR